MQRGNGVVTSEEPAGDEEIAASVESRHGMRRQDGSPRLTKRRHRPTLCTETMSTSQVSIMNPD